LLCLLVNMAVIVPVIRQYFFLFCLAHVHEKLKEEVTSSFIYLSLKPLTPKDTYMRRTAPLTFKGFILYIYSTNIGTEYFKYGVNSPFFSLQNAVCFIILTYLVIVLFTFYIQGVLKFKKK